MTVRLEPAREGSTFALGGVAREESIEQSQVRRGKERAKALDDEKWTHRPVCIVHSREARAQA